MKTIKTIIWISMLVLFFSCNSDDLSNNNAEKIISACLDENPRLLDVTFNINKTSFRKNDKKLGHYKTLADNGFIEMTPVDEKKSIKKPKGDDPLAKWRYEAELRRIERNGNTFVIKITKKANKFIENAPEKRNIISMKSHKYIVDEVLEVHEIPSENQAKVKVRYKAIDITPFAVLSVKDPSKAVVETLTMKKTSNGWKYCDNF